jgi:hypothetical protein
LSNKLSGKASQTRRSAGCGIIQHPNSSENALGFDRQQQKVILRDDTGVHDREPERLQSLKGDADIQIIEENVFKDLTPVITA